MDIINQRLFELSDASYRDFHSKLIPNIEKERIIGVRTPVLRKYARELSRESLVNDFLNELPHYYYEENNLHAFILSLKKGDITEIIHEIEIFLPYIDNWATCDMFSPKIFKKHPALIYDKCMEWIKSEKTYTVRFAIVTLTNLYLDENYRKEILDVIASIHSEEYYINMAIAWFFSYALIKRYDDTIPLFTEKRLDKWVHNKSLQKAIESLRIAGDTKAYLRTLKIR